MGVVYRAKSQRNGKVVALKMLPPEALNRPDSALRFKREFRAMQKVEHPNVIRVFDSGSHDGCPFFTMEVVEGRDIRSWLDGDDVIVPHGKDPPPSTMLSERQRARLNDPIRVRKLADAINQVGFALSSIHSHRIVHRDLKPDNILVSKAGVVKLMDFGIAKQITGHTEHSSGGVVVGTFKYLSPEQALGADVDGRADLYCLGIILYELLAGRHPFYSENSVGYAYHHARRPPPPITKFNPEVNPGLLRVCAKLIEKDPRDRYPTAEDVILAVREAMESEESRKARPAPSAPAPQRASLFAPALVGRGREMRALQSVLEELRQGNGSIVTITGSPGMGKTRLLRDLAPAARQVDVEVIVATARKGSAAPYGPYVEALDRIIDDIARSRPTEVLHLLGAEAPILARYLGSIERLGTGARPRALGRLEPDAEKLRFMNAVSGFLGRLSLIRPRVLCIDGLAYADELSLELTLHLARHRVPRPDIDGRDLDEGGMGAPVALVLTLDPTNNDAAAARSLVSRLSRSAQFLSLNLGPLASGEVREMLQTMIGGADVAKAVGDVLHADTGGNPGRVEARIRAWAEDGALQKKGREWVLLKRPSGNTDIAAPSARRHHGAIETLSLVDDPVVSEVDDIPSQVVELKAATRADIPVPNHEESPEERRVKNLSSLARDVAERCAVAGELLTSTLIERLALRSEAELLDALNELIDAGVLEEDAEEGEIRLQTNERKALLRLMSPDRKTHLHELAARAIEEDARRWRRAADPEVLARHHLEGGEPLKALEHLMTAARLALEASATQSAAERVREGQELFLDACGTMPADQRVARIDADLVLLRLDVLAAVGEHKECVSLATRRLPRLRSSVDPRRRGELLLRLATSERVLGELDAALEHVGEVLSLTERGRAHALRCRAKSLAGAINAQRGQFEKSDRYWNEAFELARAIGDEIEEERARSALAGRHLDSGNLGMAQSEFQSLYENARSRGEQLHVARYVNALGLVTHERAKFDDAEKRYRKAISLAKPAGDRRQVAVGLGNIGVLRRDQGRADDALKLLRKSARVLTEIDDLEALAYCTIAESQTLLVKGDDDAARERAEEAIGLAQSAGAIIREAEARMCRGLAMVRLGEAGRSEIEAGLSVARETGFFRVVLYGLVALGEAHTLEGDRASAGIAFEDGIRRATRAGYRRSRDWLEQARARMLQGSESDAS